MRMLSRICGHTRRDKIRMKTFNLQDKVGVAVYKMREARMRWFGHVKTL